MDNLLIRTAEGVSVQDMPVEMVERKGLGHPDTLCDGLAEALSQALCHYYQENFGLILHHNVDKVLLRGGASRPRFGGGEVLEPICLYLAGRASVEFHKQRVPLDALVQQVTASFMTERLRHLDGAHHLQVHNLVRSGSVDLVALFERGQKSGIALANDTSCGVGYAPFTPLENIVLKLESFLTGNEFLSAHPWVGEDIKIMAVRRGEAVDLTIACAFVDSAVLDIHAYRNYREQLRNIIESFVGSHSPLYSCRVTINAADVPDAGQIYLTVTGTSAEAGDDGAVGRGNRVNGLISPYRPMNMEAAAGKNPVSHVGKLYNLVAHHLANGLVSGVEAVAAADVFLVSRIGHPVDRPHVVDVCLRLQSGAYIEDVRVQVHEIVNDVLSNMARFRQALLRGEIRVY